MKNSNLIVQGISLLLWILAFAGLEIQPDQVANDGYTALVTQNWPLITIVVINLIGSIYKWYQTWTTDRPNFVLFLRSPYWWASFANIAFSFAAMQGIVLPADAALKIVEFAFAGEWWQLAGYLFPSVIAPIVYWLTNKRKQEINAATTAEKTGLAESKWQSPK